MPGDERGWQVGVMHPNDPERRLAIVHLKNQALGTSSATYRHLEWMGRKLGHILDPRRGWPAETMASASVLATTAAEADGLATAFFILGVEMAQEYLAKRTELGAVLLPADPGAMPQMIGAV
jgi:thiamine biosynthesis lipoprotein